MSQNVLNIGPTLTTFSALVDIGENDQYDIRFAIA